MVKKPKATWGEDQPWVPSLTVYEADTPPSMDTGILDVNGVRIHRASSRQPIGFDLRKTK